MGQFDYARGWTDDLSGLPQTPQPQVPVNVGASPYPSLPSQPMPQIPSLAQQGGGMFGGGKANMWQILAGALNGYLAGSAGPGQQAGLQNIQMMQALAMKRQQRQQEIDDYNRTRADRSADWRTQYDYELAHPKEGNGSEYERLLTAAGITPGTPQYQQHVTAKVNQLENPMVMTPYGPMPYSAVNPVGPKVGDIVDDPRKQGGQTGAPSGGFPY